MTQGHLLLRSLGAVAETGCTSWPHTQCHAGMWGRQGFPDHSSHGSPMWESGSFPQNCLYSCPQAGFAAYLHLEEDVVPAGLVELVGVEEECEDVVGIGTVFRQSLGILFRVARRQLEAGDMFGEEGKLFAGNFCAGKMP